MAEEVQAHTSAEAGGGGGFASQLMTPDPGVMIWVWVVFIVLLVLLHKFVWKPVLKAVAEREARLKESLAKAEELSAKSTALEVEQARILAETRSQAGAILAEQRDFATKFRAQAEAEAKASAEKIVDEARTEILTASEQARTALRRDAAELSVKVAEKILRSELDGAKAQDYAERMLAEATKN